MQPSPHSSSPLPSASSSGGKLDFEPNEEWKRTTWHELCSRRKDTFIPELAKLRTAGVKDPSLEQNILHGLEKLDTETYYEKVEQERQRRKTAWSQNMARQSTVAQSTSQQVTDSPLPIDPPKPSSSGDNILPLSPDIQRKQLRYPIVSAAQPIHWQQRELGLQKDVPTSPSSSMSAQASTSPFWLSSLNQDATPQTTPDSLHSESRLLTGNHSPNKAPVVLNVACPQPYTLANAHNILFPSTSPKPPDDPIETASDSNASVLSANKEPKKTRLRSNTCIPTKTQEETQTANRKRRKSTLPNTSSSSNQTFSKPVPTRSNSIASSSNHRTRNLYLDPIPEYSAVDGQEAVEQTAEVLSSIIEVPNQNVGEQEQHNQDNITRAWSRSAKEELDASSTKYAPDVSTHADKTSMLWGTGRKDAPGTRLQDMSHEEDDDEILLDFARPSLHDRPDHWRHWVEENLNLDSLSIQETANPPKTVSTDSVPFGIFSERRIVESPTKSLTLLLMPRDDIGNIVDYGDLNHSASIPNVDTENFHRSIPPRETQAVTVSPKTQSFMTWNDINASALFPREIRRKVEEIIQQPQATPWADVGTMAPGLHQTVMDALQAILDYSPHLQRGFRREAAIKSLQAINRVSGCLPREMELQNVQRVSERIVDGGGFSDIFWGTYRSQKVCLKVLRLYTSDSHTMAKAFRQEALLWRQLDHPRILPLLGIDVGMSPQFCMVSPWMEHGNVNKFLESNPKHNRLKMVLEIIEGIEYLHTHNPPMVHADVRGANILVRNDLTCCLADFGLTMVIETRSLTQSRLGRGTSHWMPPEVWWNDSEPDTCLPARDIYSFGCTIIEIYSGRPPFPHLKGAFPILNEVVYLKRKPPRPEEITDTALWTIVEDCLAFASMARPAAGKVRELIEALVSVQVSS